MYVRPVCYIRQVWLMTFKRRFLRRLDYHRQVDQCKRGLKTASTYEEWSTCAIRLDYLLPHLYRWKHDIVGQPVSHHEVRDRVEAMEELLQAEEDFRVDNMLRFSLSRNFAGIANPRLFDQLYGGTKAVSEKWINCALQALDFLVSRWDALPIREKIRNIATMRNSVSRTVLVLQGGRLFGLYHLGVLRELHRQRMLPKLILGTAAGAIMAALVAPLTDEELEEFLLEPGAITDAFKWREGQIKENDLDWFDRVFGKSGRWFDILKSRVRELFTSGWVLDLDALQHCVDTELEDMTFEEAHNRSGREISITIACDAPGMPALLNYITTPNILIRSAVRAAMETDFDKAPAKILEKDWEGTVQRWSLNDETPAYKKRRRARDRKAARSTLIDHDHPLERLKQIFHANHFITSQARPYLLPFCCEPYSRVQLPTPFPRCRLWLRTQLRRVLVFRARQMMHLTTLPMWAQKLAMETRTSDRVLTIAPTIRFQEVRTLFRRPSKDTVDHWIEVGEKSVWPCMAAIKIRCNLEMALQRYSDQMEEQHPREWWLVKAGR